jgi:hypothetical protein
MILSYSLDCRQLPLDILFILILCFHILILILMLARCRSKLRQLFRKRWHSLDKSAIAEQQSILIEPHILDNTQYTCFVYIPVYAKITAVYPRKRPPLRLYSTKST